MERNVIKIKENEELLIISEKESYLVSNKSEKLEIIKQKSSLMPNIYIKNMSTSDITNYVAITMLENNDFYVEDQKHINKLFDNFYNEFSGDNYNDLEIEDMFFQCITIYETKIKK